MRKNRVPRLLTSRSVCRQTKNTKKRRRHNKPCRTRDFQPWNSHTDKAVSSTGATADSANISPAGPATLSRPAQQTDLAAFRTNTKTRQKTTSKNHMPRVTDSARNFAAQPGATAARTFAKPRKLGTTNALIFCHVKSEAPPTECFLLPPFART